MSDAKVSPCVQMLLLLQITAIWVVCVLLQSKVEMEQQMKKVEKEKEDLQAKLNISEVIAVGCYLNKLNISEVIAIGWYLNKLNISEVIAIGWYLNKLNISEVIAIGWYLNKLNISEVIAIDWYLNKLNIFEAIAIGWLLTSQQHVRQSSTLWPTTIICKCLRYLCRNNVHESLKCQWI